MKKLLSILLTLMLVFVISASAVMADEPVSNGMPADFDETSIVQYLVFDFSGTKEDKDLVSVEVLMTGTDGTLTYYAEMYAAYGQPVEESTYDGNRALSLQKTELKKSELSDAGIGYVYEEGFLTDKEYYVYVGGSMMNSGAAEGEKVATIVFKLDGRTESFDVIVGNSNTFMFQNTMVNLITVLILVIALIVIALVVVIIVLTLKSKKKVDKQKALKDEEFVSEDEIFEELVEEAGVENDDAEETEEAEAEEAVEEVEDEEENK